LKSFESLDSLNSGDENLDYEARMEKHKRYMDRKEKEQKRKMCMCKNHGGQNIIKRNITFAKK